MARTVATIALWNAKRSEGNYTATERNQKFLGKRRGNHDLRPKKFVRYKRHSGKPLEKKVSEPRSSEVEKVYSQHAIPVTLFSRIACDSLEG